jgi:hypothetical protein
VIAGSDQDLDRMGEDRTLGKTIVETLNRIIGFGVKCNKKVGSGCLFDSFS